MLINLSEIVERKNACCSPMLYTLFQQVNKSIETVAALLGHMRAKLQCISESSYVLIVFDLISFYSWPQMPQGTAGLSSPCKQLAK